jgi:hypothetical protein
VNNDISDYDMMSGILYFQNPQPPQEGAEGENWEAACEVDKNQDISVSTEQKMWLFTDM